MVSVSTAAVESHGCSRTRKMTVNAAGGDTQSRPAPEGMQWNRSTMIS
jgi:hypothetical protein